MSQSGEPERSTSDDPSLDELADDLAAVEQALERLEDGSYWTGDVADDPTARRTPPPSAPAP
jgi:hypothetical protein